MKIGVAGSSLNNRDILSGSAVTLLGLINALRLDNEVFWISFEPELKEEEFSPVPIIYSTKDKIRSIAQDLNLDVLVLEVWASNITALAREFSRVGTKVVMWDDNSPYALYRWKNVVKYADLILTHGEGGKRIIENRYPGKKVETFFFATDPERFKPVKDRKFACDVSFIGTNITKRLEPLVNLFFEQSKAFPGKNFVLYGGGWDKSSLLKKYKNVIYKGWAKNEDLPKIFFNSKITINGTRAGLNETLLVPSNRIFDVMSSGGVLLSDPLPGIEKLFNVGEELLIANSKEEATKIINLILEDEDKRQRISQNARNAILHAHTWNHRKEQLLEHYEK